MRSAIYEGFVTHRRLVPVRHEFRYRIALPYVDLDEVDELCARHPLWSARGPNAVWFRRQDFLDGASDTSLKGAVQDLVAARGHPRPTGPVAMLAHLRTWGWLFNPITVYFCFAPDGTGIDAVVAEVTNTPWHERHAYVLAPGAGAAGTGAAGTGAVGVEHRFAKALHVSPFMGMDQEYALRCDAPGDRLDLRLASLEAGARVFEAGLTLRRRDATRRELGRLLWSYPLMTLRVSLAIRRQALSLWRKGAPVHPHPRRDPAVRPDREPVGSAR